MGKLNKPVFLLSIILMFIVVLCEAGSVFFTSVSPEAVKEIAATGSSAPGIGIPYLAVFDLLVVFSVMLITASLIIPERIQGKIQGIITLVFSLILLITCILLIISAIIKLSIMVGLLVSPIFGTLAYLAIFGHFKTTAARLILGYIMTLKIAFVILLIISHVRFLENKGLIFILLTSIAAGVIVSILHGLVPGFLVSITDGIAGIIVLIIAVVWSVFFLAGSIKSLCKAVV